MFARRALASLGLLAYLAAIGSCQNLGTANNFNGFFFNSGAAQSGSAQGAMAFGGAWRTLGNYSFSTLSNSPSPNLGFATNLGVYTVGQFDAGASFSTFIHSGRNAYVGGQLIGNPVMVGGGNLHWNSYEVNSIHFFNQWNYSTSQSNMLFNHGGHSIDLGNGANYQAVITNPGGTNFFSIDGSLLAGGKTLNVVGGNGSETLVFNVKGTTIDWGTSYSGSKTKTLWNFANATTLNVTGATLTGSVLARNADVFQSRNIEGTLISTNLFVTNGAELQSNTFNGTLAVPEPGLLLCLPGAIGLFSLRRRKRV
ncbi:choice-of-anchor A family protein [Kamptonema cortianum]|nr:choice-of-anchor A family protein [Geitlerinema splendidum]MDK3157663.1 choice-of-anchor A family protein [Kamptonema cortianum]